MFENRVLRRIFGPKRDEVTGEWRKLHNDELNDLQCSPNNVRLIKSRRMSGAYGVGERRVQFWWINLRERDHWGDPGADGGANIKMYLQEVGCGGMDWIELTKDRGRRRALVNAVMNLRVS